jgi:3',5'-cyclic AMP phosphodiesterase CpdA
VTNGTHVTNLPRREALRTFVAAGAAFAAAPRVLASAPDTSSGVGARKRALRLAHPTDIHVQPELRGGQGMRACFEHMLALSDPPQLIITGGDLPMDSASSPEPRSRVQWDLFRKVLADTVGTRVPIQHTLGNHDIFGRDKVACKATGNEPFYGRRWFLDNFGYERTYRSFDNSGWHVIILDSIDLLPDGDEYAARITGEQLDWLKADLASTPKTTPVLVISHVPILSVATYFDKAELDQVPDSLDLRVSSKRTHVDCRELEALFRSHGNVKLCLSGHLHLLDRCMYNGITYICDGAVSGAKWKGHKCQTPEGYGLIDLYADGSFEHQYVTFGWNAKGK